MGHYFCGWKWKYEKLQKFLPAKLNQENFSFKEDDFILEAHQEFLLNAKVLTGRKFAD